MLRTTEPILPLVQRPPVYCVILPVRLLLAGGEVTPIVSHQLADVRRVHAWVLPTQHDGNTLSDHSRQQHG